MDTDNTAAFILGRLTSAMITIFSVMEAILGVVVLVVAWNDPCDRQLKLWLIVLIARLILRMCLQYHIDRQRDFNEQHQDISEPTNAHKLREFLDVFGLIWFTVGNAWVFSSQSCKNELCCNCQRNVYNKIVNQVSRHRRCCTIHVWRLLLSHVSHELLLSDMSIHLTICRCHHVIPNYSCLHAPPILVLVLSVYCKLFVEVS